MTVAITTRAAKGAVLTSSELDTNFLNLKFAVEALQAAAASVTPTISLVGPLAYTVGAAVGTLVGYINGVPNGVVPYLVPDDGRLVISGSQAAGWKLSIGAAPSSAGTTSVTVSAVGATSGAATIVVTAAGTATLTLAGPLTYNATDPAGTVVGYIGNVPNGVTPKLLPSDNRLVVTGSQSAGWVIAVGPVASTAGSLAITVSATSANSVAATLPITGGSIPTLPTLTLSGALAYTTTSLPGTAIASIGNVPNGITPTITPNDGRLAVTGSQSSGWTVVVGNGASTAGTITLNVSATGANSTSANVVVTDSSSGSTPTLTLSGPLTFTTSDSIGTQVAAIGNVPSGVTPTLTPSDGRLVIAGNAVSGWKVQVGATTSSVGTIALTVGATGATSATATVSVTALPTVTLSGAQSQAEGNSGAVLYTFTVTRTTSTGAVNVPWSFSAGTTDNQDYTGGVLPAGGTVSISNGQTSGTIIISVNGDAVVENDETFTVSITPPSGYAAGNATSATGTILNDDLPALTLAGPFAYTTTSPAGTLVATIANVPAGATPSVVPNDGRLTIAGDATAGWKVVTGATASASGTISFTVSATGATSVNGTAAVSNSTSGQLVFSLAGNSGLLAALIAGSSPAPTLDFTTNDNSGLVAALVA